MKIITGGLGSGKTTELIKLCAENGGYIVTRSFENAHRIARQAEKMGLSIAYPFTYQEFVERRYYGRGVKKVYIDDVDVS